MTQERELDQQNEQTDKFLSVMWSFLPNMIAPITFVVFLSTGNTMSYSQLMEAVMLLGKA